MPRPPTFHARRSSSKPALQGIMGAAITVAMGERLALVAAVREQQRNSGPAGLRRVRGFSDEALKGEWKGYRSSRLDDAYRVVYRTEGDLMLVMVERVSKHDYRR